MIDADGLNLVIIGDPASGKTFCSQRYKDSHLVIHTDDYIKYGYKDSIYKIIEELDGFKAPFAIEGVGGYRLLRKCAELKIWKPDLIINVTCPLPIVMQIYRDERQDRDFKKVQAMAKANATVWGKYREIDNSVSVVQHANIW